MSHENGPPQKKFKIKSSNKICPFGEICYRKNPIHFMELGHPHLEDIYKSLNGDLSKPLSKFNLKNPETTLIQLKLLKEIKNKDECKSQVETSTSNSSSSSSSSSIFYKNDNKNIFTNVNEKIEASAPFRCFLTMIRSSKETHKQPYSIAFHQLLDPSLGEIESTLQITFMVEFEWLLYMYECQKLSKSPMLVVHGVPDPEFKPESLPSHIKCLLVKPPTIFGHHHTKMSIFSYKDKSLRVVVTTANLISSDWENRTQGLWISPKCPPLGSSPSSSNSGEAPTNFREDLIRYLSSYDKPDFKPWINKILSCDFSAVNVFLIASIPGSHEGPNINKWGHRRLGNILKRYAENLDSDNASSSIIAQCSSIGSLGETPQSWLCGEFLQSLSECQNGDPSKPEMRVIYPSLNNVKSSYDGLAGGACLPYSKRTHKNQMWFDDYLYQWKSENCHRSRAMPHIKTYCRFNENFQKLSFFILTSANISKAAWGNISKSKSSVKLRILSYECGILFLPKFITNTSYFNLNDSLPLPYDIPLKKYEKNDKTWVNEMMF